MSISFTAVPPVEAIGESYIAIVPAVVDDTKIPPRAPSVFLINADPVIGVTVNKRALLMLIFFVSLVLMICQGKINLLLADAPNTFRALWLLLI